MENVSIISPVYWPELESCFENRLEHILNCTDTTFRPVMLNTDTLNFQLRQTILSAGIAPFRVYINSASDPEAQEVVMPSAVDVQGYRYYNYSIDISAYTDQDVCLELRRQTIHEETHISGAWPISVISPQSDPLCEKYLLLEYTSCGFGMNMYWGDTEGNIRYQLRVPLAPVSSSFTSDLSSFFSSLGGATVCNSVHEKVYSMSTFEFIPQWLAHKIQIAASLNNFKIEGTRYFLNADPIRTEPSGFGLYNYEFTFKLAQRFSKSACCQ